MFDTITSLQLSDTIPAPRTTVLHTTAISYDGTPIPSNVNTENWIFSVVFILFVILIVGISRSHNWITEAFRNITKTRIRSSLFSKTTAEEYQSKLLLTIFATGLISLYLYLSLTTESVLKLSTYLIFFVSSGTFLIIKVQLMNLIAYVFFDQERLKTIKTNYFNMLSFVGFLIFPLLILKMYFYVDIDPKVFDIIAIIISLSGLVLVSVTIFRVFLHKILDFFHIMLYLCTLEILPLIGIFHLYILILKEF